MAAYTFGPQNRLASLLVALFYGVKENNGVHQSLEMASYVESRVTEVENKPAGKPVDREKVCHYNIINVF